jgi:hypothetical protein
MVKPGSGSHQTWLEQELEQSMLSGSIAWGNFCKLGAT